MKHAQGLFYILFSVYIGVCALAYFLQGYLLFPAHAVPSVSDAWKPTRGSSDIQSFIKGRCGNLHVVKWPVANAKGTIMVFHGNGESIASVETQVSQFHQLGFSVMAWDYPGYGRSQRCWFSQKDLLSDAKLAYQWLENQPQVGKIVLYGRSIGSGIALYVASQYRLPVLLVSPYDALRNVAKQKMPFFIPVDFLIRYPLDVHPWVEKIQAPIYAIHGLDDRLILPERAAALAKSSQGKVHITWVAHAGHNDIILFEQSDSWLKQHLAKIVETK